MLCLIVMVIGQNWRMMSKVQFTDDDVKKGIENIKGVSSIVDSVMSPLGLDPIEDFMINMALKESYAGAGYDTTATHTMGPWQIDPIRMYDIQQNILNSKTYQTRADTINNYLRSVGYPEDFNIGNTVTVLKDGDSYSYGDMGQYANDPLVNAFLARLGLSSVGAEVPNWLAGDGGEGGYWKRHWNKSGAGDPQEYIDMVQHWRPEYAATNYNFKLK